MRVIAQQNDTIDKICHRVFGSTAGITEQVLKLNPHITSTSPILALGTKIELPDNFSPSQTTVNLWD